MEGRFFEPDEKICIIIDNVNYEKLRELPEFAAEYGLYDDIPQARYWADTFENGIKAYGFSEDQIRRYKDADYSTIEQAINSGANSVKTKIGQNASQGRRTLLLCFYAGHGTS